MLDDLALWRFCEYEGSEESLSRDLERENSLGGEREGRVEEKGSVGVRIICEGAEVVLWGLFFFSG